MGPHFFAMKPALLALLKKVIKCAEKESDILPEGRLRVNKTTRQLR